MDGVILKRDLTGLRRGGSDVAASGFCEQPVERPIANTALLSTAMWIRAIPKLRSRAALCESDANGREVAWEELEPLQSGK